MELKMKKYLVVMLAVWGLSLLTISCSDNDKEPVVIPTASGTVADKDGNEYHWVRIGQLDWMTENLHCDLPFYEDLYNDKWTVDGYYPLSLGIDAQTREQYYENFGNYYTWQEAVDDAPEGWRLPTDEDFKTLERQLGMAESDLDKEGWRNAAGFLMAQQDGTMLNFRYGGQICNYDGTISMGLYHPGDYGYYWTATSSTVNNEAAAWARMITPVKNAVKRLEVLQDGHCLSVRYVRDVQ